MKKNSGKFKSDINGRLYKFLWLPMCSNCLSGNITRITKGMSQCNDCGKQASPIDFFGMASCPQNTLLIQKGMEVPINPSLTRSSPIQTPLQG